MANPYTAAEVKTRLRENIKLNTPGNVRRNTGETIIASIEEMIDMLSINTWVCRTPQPAPHLLDADLFSMAADFTYGFSYEFFS